MLLEFSNPFDEMNFCVLFCHNCKIWGVAEIFIIDLVGLYSIAD
ncbi:hypothetical protein SLEP1_g26160 [Rubroshorea leprosula]|uniref:Uncharacterized protein n=1 Tax=Rubroshorea leprosula TaxID=152421 RepID=A0AAV5JRM7_9ROSI|nr:hypothetical protein SLEP1_g26160 [Rubroshorea leprosula]